MNLYRVEYKEAINSANRTRSNETRSIAAPATNHLREQQQQQQWL